MNRWLFWARVAAWTVGICVLAEAAQGLFEQEATNTVGAYYLGTLYGGLAVSGAMSRLFPSWLEVRAAVRRSLLFIGVLFVACTVLPVLMDLVRDGMVAFEWSSDTQTGLIMAVMLAPFFAAFLMAVQLGPWLAVRHLKHRAGSSPAGPSPSEDDGLPPEDDGLPDRDNAHAGGDDREPATRWQLEPSTAAVAAYLLGWLSGLVIFLVIAKDNEEVRYHAAQSMLVFGGANLTLLVLPSFRITRPLFVIALLVVGFGGFVLWIYLMIQAAQSNHVKVPVIGDWAESLAARRT